MPAITGNRPRERSRIRAQVNMTRALLDIPGFIHSQVVYLWEMPEPPWTPAGGFPSSSWSGPGYYFYDWEPEGPDDEGRSLRGVMIIGVDAAQAWRHVRKIRRTYKREVCRAKWAAADKPTFMEVMEVILNVVGTGLTLAGGVRKLIEED